MPPIHAIDFRCLFAYAVGMDQQRETGALLIAACIIAAIRLRGEPDRLHLGTTFGTAVSPAVTDGRHTPTPRFHRALRWIGQLLAERPSSNVILNVVLVAGD